MMERLSYDVRGLQSFERSLESFHHVLTLIASTVDTCRHKMLIQGKG